MFPAHVAFPLPHSAFDPSWDALTRGYLAETYGRSRSRRTTQEYARLLHRFFAGVRAAPSEVEPFDIHAFAYGIGPSGRFPSPATIGVRLAAVSGYFDFALRMGAIASNPAARVRRPRQVHRVPDAAPIAEVRQLVASLPSDRHGIRDRALIITAVLTGLRRAELASIEISHVTLRSPATLRVRTKGGNDRVMALPPPVTDALLTWLRARCVMGDTRLFGLSGAGVYAAIRRRQRAAGLSASLTPHRLRHAAAQLWRAYGASIEAIGALLGHSSIATTVRYLDRAAPPATTEHWRAAAGAIGVSEIVGTSNTTP